MTASTDEVLKLCIGFNSISTKYVALKNAVRSRKIRTVEAMHAHFTHVWLALGKTTYLNIALDQVEGLWVKRLCYIL